MNIKFSLLYIVIQTILNLLKFFQVKKYRNIKIGKKIKKLKYYDLY